MNQNQAMPHGLRGLTPLPYWWVPYALTALAALILLGVLAWWLWRRWRNRPPAETAVPARLATIALDPRAQLAQLRVPDPYTDEAQRRFYFELTAVLRLALERAGVTSAQSLTNAELATALPRYHVMVRAECEDVVSFLRQTDRVKFADAAGQRERAISDYDQVANWVQRLQPKPLGAPENEVPTHVFS